MKKFWTPLLTIALITACSDKPAETTTPTAMMGEDAMPMQEGDAGQTMDKGSMPMMEGATAGTSATAEGTVESIDPAGGRIVIAHGPVEALKWPAMTMGFIATADQVQSVEPGQKVTFDFSSQGANNTITRIESAQ